MTNFNTDGLQKCGRIVIGRIGVVLKSDLNLINTQIDIGYVTYKPTKAIAVPIYKTNTHDYAGELYVYTNGQVSIFCTQSQYVNNGYTSSEIVYFTEE